jgi:repressor LexA
MADSRQQVRPAEPPARAPRASEVAAQLGESARCGSRFPDGPTDADGLTLRQRRILEMIQATVESRGYPPRSGRW